MLQLLAPLLLQLRVLVPSPCRGFGLALKPAMVGGGGGGGERVALAGEPASSVFPVPTTPPFPSTLIPYTWIVCGCPLSR